MKKILMFILLISTITSVNANTQDIIGDSYDDAVIVTTNYIDKVEIKYDYYLYGFIGLSSFSLLGYIYDKKRKKSHKISE